GPRLAEPGRARGVDDLEAGAGAGAVGGERIAIVAPAELEGMLAAGERPREETVHEGDEGPSPAPAFDEGAGPAARRLDARRDPLEDRDVGAAELVDRLLGGADDEKRRRRRPHETEELVLEAVRVLELVDEDGGVARPLVRADRGVAGEKLARRREEVGEVEDRPPALLSRVGVARGGDELDELRAERR